MKKYIQFNLIIEDNKVIDLDMITDNINRTEFISKDYDEAITAKQASEEITSELKLLCYPNIK